MVFDDVRARAGVLSELIRFIYKRKRSLLLPILAAAILFVAALAFTQVAPVARFVYPLF